MNVATLEKRFFPTQPNMRALKFEAAESEASEKTL